MFSAVSFFHHLSNSAHGAPGGDYSTEQRKEDREKISTNPTLGLMSEWPFFTAGFQRKYIVTR